MKNEDSIIEGLSGVINDYVEGNLDSATRKRFEKYLEKEMELNYFVQRCIKGKTALQNSYRVQATDDFEQKLAERIAEERVGEEAS